MRPNLRRVGIALVAVCTAAASVSVWATAGHVRAVDRGNSGRLDEWRFYDAGGEIVRVDADTNHDGRSDRQEYYANGALVRRESDRNFDGRIDLVEDFASAAGHTRSVVDVDFDGAADLLVIFQNGTPVFSEYAPRTPNGTQNVEPRTASRTLNNARRTSNDTGLVPLLNPFDSVVAFRSLPVSPGPQTGVATTSPIGVSVAASAAFGAAASSRHGLTQSLFIDASPVSLRSARAPPAFLV